MGDYEFPRVPELEEALRAAHRALEPLATPGLYEPEEEITLISDVISQFHTMLDFAAHQVAGQFGPPVSWREPRRPGAWDLISTGVDLDAGECDFGEFEPGTSFFEGPAGEWRDSGLNRAARAYSREAGWDVAPDDTGVWMLMLAPVRASGDGDDGPWYFTGHLVGFVILQDRDEDGSYESVAHIWTARAWRRRGVARRLLADAHARFPITGVEGPYTADGSALLTACPPSGLSEEAPAS